MLVPVEIMQRWLHEQRADIPINAIHMHSIYKWDETWREIQEYGPRF